MANRSGPMICPVDQTNLVMSERQGIEIDYCPTCRGVWLDRGELDKIVERTLAPGGGPGSVRQQPGQGAPPPQQGYAPPPQQGYGAPPPQQGYGVPPQQGYGAPPPGGHWQPHMKPAHYGDDYYKSHGYKRKKHWMEELFD